MIRFKTSIDLPVERGFVLVSVIWTVAIASIVIAFASVQIERGLTKAVSEKKGSKQNWMLSQPSKPSYIS